MPQRPDLPVCIGFEGATFSHSGWSVARGRLAPCAGRASPIGVGEARLDVLTFHANAQRLVPRLETGDIEKIRRLNELSADIRALPADLPIPVDDGAADHLLDAAVPAVSLSATVGGPVNLADAASATLVVYVYPKTGVPGQPLPAGWDRIPGARGCTPQSCAFRDSAQELADLGATVCGLSAQDLDEQREFASREHIPYPLLNDSDFRLAAELGLPTFEADGGRYYRRLTFIARRGRIAKVLYPVFPPQDNAADVIAWLRAQTV